MLLSIMMKQLDLVPELVKTIAPTEYHTKCKHSSAIAAKEQKIYLFSSSHLSPFSGTNQQRPFHRRATRMLAIDKEGIACARDSRFWDSRGCLTDTLILWNSQVIPLV
jgi:hypothetical protein